MIKTPAAKPTDRSSSSSLGNKIVGVLVVLILAALAIAAAFFMGRQLYREEWQILVTASGLAVYFVVAFIDARHALLLWIVTAPFARFVYLNIELGRGIPNLTLNRLMTGALVVLVLAQIAIRRRKPARFTWLGLFILLFAGAASLSVPSAVIGLNSAAQGLLDLILIPVAIFFLANTLVTSRREFRGVMIALLLIGLYLGFLATREQLTGNVWFYPEDRSVQYTDSIRRVVALLGNPAYIAVTIVMTVPWAWYLFLNVRRGRLWILLAIGLMISGIYFCMNRSGWVGLVVSMFVMALFVRRFRRIFILLCIIGAIVGSIYWALIVTSATFQERLKAQGPIDYRMETWEIAWRMIEDNPAFGVGWENFTHYYKRYGKWDIYLRATPTPHNTYLWVTLMGGLAALVPFGLMLCALLISALRYRAQTWAAGEVVLAEMTGVFLGSMAGIWAPAFVMDILTGYYNTMVMFFIIGSFFGMMTGEQQRRRLADQLNRLKAASAGVLR